MTDVTSSQSKMQVEELQFKSAISEATATRIGANINSIIDGNGEPLGTVITSILTVSQFTAIRPASKWVRMEGQSIVGSDLELLTGMSTLPDMVSTESFIGQADLTETNLTNYEASQNKSHRHESLEYRTNTGAGGGQDGVYLGPVGSAIYNESSYASSGGYNRTGLDGGTVARPETVRMNLFIKINN